jgi:hypothetical protein
MTEELAHLFEVAMLPVDFHRNAMTKIVRLQLRIADQANACKMSIEQQRAASPRSWRLEAGRGLRWAKG